MRTCQFVFTLYALAVAFSAGTSTTADDNRPLRLLFLGDNNLHRPADRFAQLAPVLAQRGIELKYTDEMSVLTPQSLEDFDGLVLYANIDTIQPQQYVAQCSGTNALPPATKSSTALACCGGMVSMFA